jgi:hypothetical protein
MGLWEKNYYLKIKLWISYPLEDYYGSERLNPKSGILALKMKSTCFMLCSVCPFITWFNIIKNMVYEWVFLEASTYKYKQVICFFQKRLFKAYNVSYGSWWWKKWYIRLKWCLRVQRHRITCYIYRSF